MEKMKLQTPNLTEQNIARIRELFPNCITESTEEITDSKGNVSTKPKLAVDFDLLRQELSDSIVEGPQERYRLDWPGKRKAQFAAGTPIRKTLRPCREESVNFDETKNLFIEGDNLEAMKLMQETYLGKVKMIYIDPPYNTGHDFVYNDDFKKTSKEYLEDSEQMDEEGTRLQTNTESNGRFHSDWLSMMYPRLKLARNLLRDDGVIFISIDDSEQANLKRMCDEIFGEDNFVASILWQKRTSPDMRKAFSDAHEYVLLYGKNIKEATESFFKLPIDKDQKSRYRNPDNDPKGPWVSSDFTAQGFRPNQMYRIITPGGSEYLPPAGRCWKNVEEVFLNQVKQGKFWFGSDGNGVPRRKNYLAETDGKVPWTWWTNKEVGHTQEAKKLINALFDSAEIFSTPKPISLINRMIEIAVGLDGIILDFFAGSSATAHAVMKLNAEDGGNRKFIMVQLPEECDQKSEAYKAGYRNIAEISKERIRRAGKKIVEDLEAEAAKQKGGELFDEDDAKSPKKRAENLDIGFRVLKVDSPTMKDVYYRPDEVEQESLELSVVNTKDDRTSEDLLFHVMLDWGVDLTYPVRRETICGKEVFFVAEDSLVACFEDGVSEELVTVLAKREPLRVVFADNGFTSDSVKINVEQIFKQLSPSTEVKAI